MSVNLANIELKLLVIFDEIYSQRSITKAASRLRMSQPAVSNALNRARELTKDQLFTRGRFGMEPTEFANRFWIPVHKALDTLRDALEPPEFTAGGDHTFRLAMSDYANVVFVPRLLKHIRQAAPNVTLTILPKRTPSIYEQLDSNKIDLAVGVNSTPPRRFARAALFEDFYVTAVRNGHPLAAAPISIADYGKASHLAVRGQAESASGVDQILARQGHKRNVVLNVTQYVSAPPIVAESDLVATLFRRIANHLDLRHLSLAPFPVDSRVTISALWCRAATRNPAHAWIRRQLTHVAQQLS